MNIAIVLEATLGGTRKHVIDLVENVFLKGHSVLFLYADKRADDCFSSDLSRLVSLGITCIRLPMTKTLWHPANISCIFRMASIFRSRKISVVHLHGAVAGALGRIAAFGTPSILRIIYSPHGGVLHKMNSSFSGKMFVAIERLLDASKVFYLAVSTDEKAKLEKYLKISASKIRLIPNGIDIHQIRKHVYTEQQVQDERSKLKLKPEDVVLLYPALFLEAKGHLHFFTTLLNEKISLNPNVKILLAGNGPLESAVQKVVKCLPFCEQVQFLGFVKDIPKYFQLADAILLPSTDEAFGYVLLEAMAFGKPIFATNVGGIKDIVDDHINGFLYSPTALSTLIEKVNYFSDRPEELGKFGQESLIIVQRKFALEKTISEIRDFYTEPVAD